MYLRVFLKKGRYIIFLFFSLTISLSAQVDFPTYRPTFYSDSTYYKSWKELFLEIENKDSITSNDYWNRFIAFYKAKPVIKNDVLYYFKLGFNNDCDDFCSTYIDVFKRVELLSDNYYETENVIMLQACKSVFSMYNKELIARLSIIESEDQRYREEGADIDDDMMRKLDSINVIRINEIYEEYGYPNRQIVGIKYEHVFAYVVLHSNLSTMVKYQPIIKDQCSSFNLPWTLYAQVTDRIQLLKGEYQIYGTQYEVNDQGEHKLFRIRDLKKINLERQKINLKPLKL